MNKCVLTLAGLMFAASTVLAQGTGSPGGATGGGSPGVSGSPGGQAQGPLPGDARRTSRFDPTNAPGWQAMNELERKEMMQRMESIKTYDECRAYMTEHGNRMKSRGAQMGAAAGDPCGHMKRG